MTSHPLRTASLTAAAIALLFASALGMLATPDKSTADTLIAPKPGVLAVLVPPSVKNTKPTAFASAYVHRENCVSALLGANGDNDLAAFVAEHGQGGYTIESGQARFSATRIAIPVTFSGRAGATWPNGIGTFGYCMGDDPAIVDKAHQPPAGW